MAFSVIGSNYDLGLVPNNYTAVPVSQTLNSLTVYDNSSDVRFDGVEQENILLKERLVKLEQMMDILLKRFNSLVGA